MRRRETTPVGVLQGWLKKDGFADIPTPVLSGSGLWVGVVLHTLSVYLRKLPKSQCIQFLLDYNLKRRD